MVGDFLFTSWIVEFFSFTHACGDRNIYAVAIIDRKVRNIFFFNNDTGQLIIGTSKKATGGEWGKIDLNRIGFHPYHNT